MATQAKMRECATRNTELLSTLHSTETANTDLESHKSYISDLESQLQQLLKEKRSLDTQLRYERAGHEEYRDSVVKRFAFKATGQKKKFDAQASKEEKEYFDALQQVQQNQKLVDNAQQILDEAKGRLPELKNAVKTYAEAQRDLDSLYSFIFDGPTPDIPGEDRIEWDATRAREKLREAAFQASTQSQAVNALVDAANCLIDAKRFMQNALSHSRMDMFGGGSVNDMMERSALDKAEMNVKQAAQLHSQAKRLDPSIGHVPMANIAQGSIMSDVFFDNIFTDMAFHEKIHQSNLEVERASKTITQELTQSKARYMALVEEKNVRASELEVARRALQKARETAFAAGHAATDGDTATSVPAGTNGDYAAMAPPAGPPPEYSEAIATK